jgi:hypothetical protein
MKLATGREELVINNTVYACPFKSKRPGHSFRHQCNTSSNIEERAAMSMPSGWIATMTPTRRVGGC